MEKNIKPYKAITKTKRKAKTYYTKRKAKTYYPLQKTRMQKPWGTTAGRPLGRTCLVYLDQPHAARTEMRTAYAAHAPPLRGPKENGDPPPRGPG